MEGRSNGHILPIQVFSNFPLFLPWFLPRTGPLTNTRDADKVREILNTWNNKSQKTLQLKSECTDQSRARSSSSNLCWTEKGIERKKASRNSVEKWAQVFLTNSQTSFTTVRFYLTKQAGSVRSQISNPVFLLRSDVISWKGKLAEKLLC